MTTRHESEPESDARAGRAGRADRPPRGPTLYELYGRRSAAPASALPRLVWETVRVAWRAGRRELLVLVGADVIGAVAVLAEVLVARRLLAEVLHADRYGLRR
jgi:hypothetical protein